MNPESGRGAYPAMWGSTGRANGCPCRDKRGARVQTCKAEGMQLIEIVDGEVVKGPVMDLGGEGVGGGGFAGAWGAKVGRVQNRGGTWVAEGSFHYVLIHDIQSVAGVVRVCVVVSVRVVGTVDGVDKQGHFRKRIVVVGVAR